MMKKILFVLGSCALGVMAAVALYALASIAFLATSSIDAPRSLVARLVTLALIFSASAVALLIGGRKTSANRASVILGVLVAALSCAATLFAFMNPSSGNPASHQAELRSIAAELNAQSGSALKLPPGHVYTIRKVDSFSPYQELRIQVSDRAVARLFGVDLTKLDELGVELRGGAVSRAWVSYF